MSGNNPAAWKHPSATVRQRCHLQELADDFAPTQQEEALLRMYDTVRQYERTAQKLRETAARRKLQERQAAFEQEQQRQRGGVVKRQRIITDSANTAAAAAGNDEETTTDHRSAYYKDEEEEKAPSSMAQVKRTKRETMEMPQDEAAAAATTTDHDVMEETTEEPEDNVWADLSVKKKKKNPPLSTMGVASDGTTAATAASSLLANLGAAAVTPPHEFSTALQLPPAYVVFPNDDNTKGNNETNILAKSWSPPAEGPIAHPTDGALEMVLDQFDVTAAENGTGPNTIAVKFRAPSDSKRFSINLALADEHNDYEDILFHFNPRQRERGGVLVINNKLEGTWGQAISIPLSQMPVMFGQPSSTLVLQINAEGFDVFVAKEKGQVQHCARLEHRQAMPSGGGTTRLVLQMPSSDDYGHPEHWTVYRVWWGTRPSFVDPNTLEYVPGVHSYRADHPRKLMIRGLSKLQTVSDAEYRRAELERAFRAYGSDTRGVTVTVPLYKKFAFVEMETEQQADLALAQMADQYQLSRARRSKHEALQEERAKKEAH